MRKWIDLFEGNLPQHLYHGTTLYNLVKIVEMDFMIESEDDEGTQGVFATPSYTRAKDYGDGVIVFDSAALRSRFPVIENYYHATADELEYVIQGPDYNVHGILDCVVSIIVQRHDLEALKDISFAMDHDESDFNNHFNYDGAGSERWADALEKFLNYPKLRVE